MEKKEKKILEEYAESYLENVKKPVTIICRSSICNLWKANRMCVGRHAISRQSKIAHTHTKVDFEKNDDDIDYDAEHDCKVVEVQMLR